MSKKRRNGKRSNRNGGSNLHKYERYGKKNKHHNIAQEFGGKSDRANIYEWDINVHHAFHFLFGNRTLIEAASLLNRIHDLKLSGIELDLLANPDIDVVRVEA